MVELPDLVLASASPRRRELLRRLGLEFSVRPVDLDETPHDKEQARDYVLRLAIAKAEAAAQSRELVIAADTTVVLEGEILGKPGDVAEAEEMLQRLSGRGHEVLTGVAVRDLDRDLSIALVERTEVRFARLDEAEIQSYVASGEPMDKAGAYGIQGLGALFVQAISGDYCNVVGLPLQAVYRLLQRLGYPAPVLSPQVEA